MSASHSVGRVRLRKSFTIIPVGKHEVRLHSLTFSLALSDKDGLVAQILPLLEDSAKSVAELADALPDFGQEAVGHAVERMLEVGALKEEGAEPTTHTVETDRFRPQINFFSHFIAPADAPNPDGVRSAPRHGIEFQALLAGAEVLVLGAGVLGSAVIRSLALAGVGSLVVADDEAVAATDVHRGGWFSLGLVGRRRSNAASAMAADHGMPTVVRAVSEPSSSADLASLVAAASLVVLVRDYVRPAECQAVNRAALAAGTPWTSGRFAGFEFHLGPTVLPHETACYRCAELRVHSNLPDLAEHRIVTEFQDRGGRMRDETLMCTPGAELVALEAIKALTLFTSPAAWSAIVVLDLLRMDVRQHPVLKIPRCPDCGRPARPRPTVHAWQQRPEPVM